MKKRYTEMKWIITLTVLFCCSITVLWATEPADHQAVQPRPIQLGVSGSSIDYIDGVYCYGGTIGSLVEDINGTQYILSNNHVLARTNRGVPGEDVVQPGLIDVGCVQDPQDVVADLTGYVPIQFSGSNVADAAEAGVEIPPLMRELSNTVSSDNILSATVTVNQGVVMEFIEKNVLESEEEDSKSITEDQVFTVDLRRYYYDIIAFRIRMVR